jgi:hypothetical protein
MNGFWFIGNRRDSLEHLAVKRKAKLISPYIWRDATANPKEPGFFRRISRFSYPFYSKSVVDLSSYVVTFFS